MPRNITEYGDLLVNGIDEWGHIRINSLMEEGWVVVEVAPIFPTQYPGLRAQIAGSMQELCLVAAGDGNSAITGRPRIAKGGTIYDIYLVETGDSEASAIRIATPDGIKAIRKKT